MYKCKITAYSFFVFKLVFFFCMLNKVQTLAYFRCICVILTFVLNVKF